MARTATWVFVLAALAACSQMKTRQLGNPAPSPLSRLQEIESILRESAVSASSEWGTEAAKEIKVLVSSHEGFKVNLRVHLEVVTNDKTEVTEAIAWLQSTDAGQKWGIRKQKLCATIMMDLEKRYPSARCKVAIRTPKKWVAHAWTELDGYVIIRQTEAPPDF